MGVTQVGIIGCGTMGIGIAQLVLQKGYNVIIKEINQELLNKGLNGINKGLEKLCEKGKLKAEEKEHLLKQLKGTTNYSDLKECDVIIEAVFEDLKVKTEVFASLDEVCKKDAIFASNTSSLPISKLAACTSRKDKCIGLHFFNPVAVMPLVEVIKTIVTDNKVIQTVTDFVKSLGKIPILAKDNAGFIVNLLLTPYLLDAIRAVEKGVASIEDIDTAMKLGCNHPMGPLMLADLIGLDVLYNSTLIFFEEYKERRFASPPLLTKMVTLGFLGKKTGRGFYDWSDPNNVKPSNLEI